MTKLISLRAQFQETPDGAPEGTVHVRLVPFGEEITHEGRRISFDAGSVRSPDALVPVTMTHDRDAPMARLGKVTEVSEGPDGLYASLQVSDTTLGRDALTLLADGVLTDVSAGIKLDGDFDDGPLSGELDHVAIVAKGAFGASEKGSRVLQVLSADGGITMEDDQKVESELVTEVAELRKVIAELSVPGAIVEPEPPKFADLREFVLTAGDASRGDPAAAQRIAEFVLADDTTTTAVGVVPDFLASKVIEIVDSERPFVDTLVKDPIGSHGMSVVYPKVLTGPDVDVQATEKTEVASQAMDIDPVSVALDTYAGANDVSRQLIERSQPSFVDILFRHFASVYAQKTDAAAVAAADAAAIAASNTAIVADLSTDAAATFAAVGAGVAGIIADIRRPPTHMALSPGRWAELTSLVDADGRPLLVYGPNNPQNAQGQADFTATSGQYHGLIAYMDPNAVTDLCLIYNAQQVGAILEQAPIQLRAEVVSLLGFELGVYGLFAYAEYYDVAAWSITAA